MEVSDPGSVFLKAASKGDLTLIKMLSPESGNRGGTPKAYEMIMDGKGRNALHLAAEAGMIKICMYLVEKLKFDVDPRDYLGNTPLLLAILEHWHPAAVYLIESGAGIGYENYGGFTALHYAAAPGIGYDNYGGYTALHCAAEKGKEEMLRLLLSKGAKVMPDLDSPAGTPLHCASFHGKKESVKILLDNGADPNSVSKLYSTPLTMSITAQSYECMELLLKAGADPNLGYSGKTPLIVAACVSDTRFIIHLLKVGANPNVVNTSGLTPLELAALHGYVDAVMALFPCTSRISSFPDWSVDGIMKHVLSEEGKAQSEIRRKNDFEASKAKGRETFERKNYEDAILWYTQAKCADPTDAAVFSNRSLCWAMLNQACFALRDAKACVSLKLDWPKAHYRVGAALMLLHDYSMASKAFSVALKLDPNNKEIKKAHGEAVNAALDRHGSQHRAVLHLW